MKNKERKWLLWVLLILLPPIGIIYMWIVKKDFSQRKKIILSAIFSLWFIFALVYDNTKSSDMANIDIPEALTEEQPTIIESTEIKDTESETSEIIQIESTVEPLSPDNFIEDIALTLDGQVGKNETIQDIMLEDIDLYIYVDISQADPSPLTLEDLALSRATSITDAILGLTEYYELWESITIDFGEWGKVRNEKSNISVNESGRYFPMESFTVIHTEIESIPTPDTTSAGSTKQGESNNNFNTYNNIEQQQTTQQYVLNTSSLKIHYPSCDSVSKIAPNNYATSNLNIDELLTQGYTTCGKCF